MQSLSQGMQSLRDQLEGLFSDMDHETVVAEQMWGSGSAPEEAAQPAGEVTPGDRRPQASALPQPAAPPVVAAPRPAVDHHRRRAVNWRLIGWAVLITLGLLVLFAYGQAILSPAAGGEAAEGTPRFVVPPPTGSATASPTPTARTRGLVLLEPTATPTPPPGGWTLVLTPEARDVGWLASDEEAAGPNQAAAPNHLGDSFLFVGVAEGKVYQSVMQFDLGQVPRGTRIEAASLRLTGLRADGLDTAGDGAWRLDLLAPEMDYGWRMHSFAQVQAAEALSRFEPALTARDLGDGRINQFEFTAEQLALLEQRLLLGGERSGTWVSFRLEGPAEGIDNLFAWDSGQGVGSRGEAPELFLSLGPPPAQTPLPYYVIITSTPTPLTIATAAANSLRMTAEATRLGTATPLPPYWVTPVVVTATPTPENQATAGAMAAAATAMALTTGEPANLATATPSPTYVIVTSTPTPADIAVAAANSLRLTAEAERLGTATPLPPNWVTPVVVTPTPTPANAATAQYYEAARLTTGTPTPTPVNMQTATPTAVLIALQGELPTPAPTPTPTGTPGRIPAELVGKIAFLSDRAYHSNADTQPVEGELALPLGEPLVYVVDPDGSHLSLLSDRWAYDASLERDAYSADQRFRALVENAPPWGGQPAVFYFDDLYQVQEQVTQFGAGIAYDPAWSPAAERITLVSTESGNDEIWVINRDGSGALQLTRDGYNWWDKHPSWSPDGSKIVFWSNRDGNRRIYVMDADGSNLYSLSRTEFNDWDPVWIKYTDPPPPLPEQGK
jgi:hypothetical protein